MFCTSKVIEYTKKTRKNIPIDRLNSIRRLPGIFLFLTAILLLGVILFTITLLSVHFRLVSSRLLLPAYSLTASLALFYAAWRTLAHSWLIATGWSLFGVAQFACTFGDITWAVLELGSKQPPFPSVADVFYLVYYPLFFAGVFYLTYLRSSFTEGVTNALKMSIVIISASLYLWGFLLGPMFAGSAFQDLPGLVVSLAYPFGASILLLALLTLIFQRHIPIRRAPLLLLAAGVAVTLLAEAIFAYRFLSGVSSAGAHPFVPAFFASYILFGFAGIYQSLDKTCRATGELKPGRPQLRTSSLLTYTPHVMLIAAYSLLIISYTNRLAVNFQSLAFWVGLLIALAIAVHLVESKKVNWFNRRLQQMNTEFEKRVQVWSKSPAEKNQKLSGEAAEAYQANNSLYRAVIEDLPVFICCFRPDGTLTLVNEAYCRYFNLRREELIGRSFFTLIPEADHENVRRNYQSLTPECPVVRYEHHVIAPGGVIRWHRWTDRAVFDGDRLIEYQSIGEDITDHRLAEQALLESEAKFRDLFDNTTNLIQIVTPDFHFIYVNRAWQETLGYSQAEIASLSLLDILYAGSQVKFREAMLQALEGKEIRECEATFVARDGSLIYVKGNISCKFKAGQPEYIRGIFHDITDRRKAEEQLFHNAFHDALTALPNRAFLLKQLNQTIELAKEWPDYQFAVLFLDIDNFKLVNDSLGHSLGDQLLVAVTSRIKNCVRAWDTVARLGGDEFVILLDHVNGEADVVQVANRIRQELKEPLEIDEQQIVISVSIGIVMNSADQSAGGILRDADNAMYRAKYNGKDRFEVFEMDLRSRAMERLRLESSLRSALERQEFFLVYQPIYSIQDLRIHGMEALLRWQHPELGLLSPQDFISVAEETGIIIPLGYWVLRQACLQMRSWQEAFPSLLNVAISVNISARQLAFSDFPNQVMKILAETGLCSSSLALELTESTIMENNGLANSILEDLRALNINVHMDDFGTGYSSLDRLKSFPISTIKIDRSFIRDLGPNGSNHEIIQAVELLGRKLGLEVIAEGVEQEYQLDQLRQLGCSLGQGYYFARPMAGSEVLGFLADSL